MVRAGVEEGSRLGAGRLSAIAALAILLYLNTLGVPFLYDDLAEISLNPRVHRLAVIPSLLTTEFFHGEWGVGIVYRPILAATIPPLFLLGGGTAWPFHVANILLHALVACLVAAVVARLARRALPGLLAGLIFAAHPVHTEAVAWISGRSELMVAAFGLLAWWLHLRAREGSRWSGLGAAACLAAALGSKETAVGLPFLFGAADLLLPPPGRRGAARSPLPALYFAYGALLVLWVTARFVVLGQLRLDAGTSAQDLTLNPLVGEPWWPVRPLTWTRTLLLALGVTTFPAGPCFDYGFNQIPLLKTPWSLEPFVVAGGLALLALSAWRRLRWAPARPDGGALLLLAATGFLLAWVPASSLLIPAVSLFAERNMYLPSFGWSLAAAVVAEWAWRGAGKGRKPLLAAGVLLLASMSATTVWRNGKFADHLTIISTTTANCPGSARAHFLHAAELAALGRPEEALPGFRRALEIAPGHAEARSGLARALAALGRAEEAAVEARRARATDPAAVEARLAVSTALRAAGLAGEADEMFEEIRRDEPEDPLVRFVTAERLLAAGRLEEALDAFRRIREEDPWSPGGEAGIGKVHLKRGDEPAARRAFERALRIDPYDADTLYTLGALYLRERAPGGPVREARTLLRRLLRLRPRSGAAWARLGQAEERLGNLGAAERAFREGLRWSREDPFPRRALAAFLRRQGRESEAESLLPAPGSGAAAPEDPGARERESPPSPAQ